MVQGILQSKRKGEGSLALSLDVHLDHLVETMVSSDIAFSFPVFNATFSFSKTYVSLSLKLDATIQALRGRLTIRQKEAADLKGKYNLGQ